MKSMHLYEQMLWRTIDKHTGVYLIWQFRKCEFDRCPLHTLCRQPDDQLHWLPRHRCQGSTTNCFLVCGKHCTGFSGSALRSSKDWFYLWGLLYACLWASGLTEGQSASTWSSYSGCQWSTGDWEHPHMEPGNRKLRQSSQDSQVKFELLWWINF